MEQTNQPTQKIPKLEVLSQIGRNAVNSIRNIKRNAVSSIRNIKKNTPKYIRNLRKSAKQEAGEQSEILSQMGENIFNGITDITKGYIGEQLSTTFNVPGKRFAKKHLDIDFSYDDKLKGIGYGIGGAQDIVTLIGGYFGTLNNFVGDTPLINDDIIAPTIMVMAVLAGAKLITNAVAYPCSKLSDTYKTAKKQVQDVKVKVEGN